MELWGIAAATLSSVSWALGAILFGIIGKKISSAGMTFIKGIFSVFILGITYLIIGYQPIQNRDLLLLAISGVIGIAVGDTLFFASLKYLGAKIQIIFFMAGQIFTAILSLIFLNEVLNILQYLGILIVLAGVTFVLWRKKDDTEEKVKTRKKGVLLGVLSMLCFSTSLIIAKEALDNVSAISAVFIRMAVGTVFVLFFGLLKNDFKKWLLPLKDSGLLFTFIIAVIVVSLGGFWLSLVALKNLDVAIASILNSTEPIFVLFLALFINKEKITKTDIIGAVLTFGGIALIAIQNVKP